MNWEAISAIGQILGILITITVLLLSYFITCNRFSKKEIH